MAYISLFNNQKADLTKLKPDEQKEVAVSMCLDWFQKDRNAKRFYMDEMEEMYKLYKGDHWDLTGANGMPLRTEEQKYARPNSVENYTFAFIEGLVAEFAQEYELIDYPVEKDDEQAAYIMTNLKKFISYKNKNIVEVTKFLRNLFLYGTGIWHIYWDPTWRGGKGPNRWVGDIRWQSLHPRALFPDARCKEDINEGRRVHKALYKTIEDIKENYPDVANKITPDILRDDMLIGYELDGESYEANEEQILVVETWYKGEPLILDEGEENLGPGMHVIWWAGENNPIYLKHANYIYYDADETPLYPFIVKQCYPRENSIWGYGEAYFIKNPQIILNKTAEIILEGHMHQAVGQTMYNESALTPKQKKYVEKFGGLAGMWFPVKDIRGIRKDFPTGLPATLQNEVLRLQKAMESIIGRFDISQGKTPGSVTAFKALSLLDSRAQVRLRTKEMAITSGFEESGVYINNLINKFYTEKRRYRILGTDSKDPTYGVYNPDEMKKVYIYNTGDVIPYNQANLEGLVEGEDYEVYSPEFDVVCKVTTVMPTDRIFYIDMAKELFVTKLIDAETFWYVLEHGKFPPFEKLRLKEYEAMQKAENEQVQNQGINALNAIVPQIGQVQQMQNMPIPQNNANPEADLQQVLAQRPDLQQKLSMLPPEQQAQIIQQVMGGAYSD